MSRMSCDWSSSDTFGCLNQVVDACFRAGQLKLAAALLQSSSNSSDSAQVGACFSVVGWKWLTCEFDIALYNWL